MLAVPQETLFFLLVVRKHLGSSCWTREVVFCFSPQICCTSYLAVLVVSQLKGLKGLSVASVAVGLRLAFLQQSSLPLCSLYRCFRQCNWDSPLLQVSKCTDSNTGGKEVRECWIVLNTVTSSSFFFFPWWAQSKAKILFIWKRSVKHFCCLCHLCTHYGLSAPASILAGVQTQPCTDVFPVMKLSLQSGAFWGHVLFQLNGEK